MRLKQAVILAGGLGTRLRPVTDSMPKPMVPMNGKPFLAYLLDMLIENGITNIVLLLGYLPNVVVEYLQNNPRDGINIQYMIGEVEWETGTRVKRAEHLLDEHFLLLYSDNYLKIDLKRHIAVYQGMHADILMTVYNNRDNYSKSNVHFGTDGAVYLYDSKRTDPECNGIDAGFFIFSRKMVEEMPVYDFHLTRDFLPQAIAKHCVRCVPTDQVYYSIGSLDRLPVTQEYLKDKKVVLLDRDGVINRKAAKGEYVRRVEEFAFLPGAIEAIALLTANGYRIYIASNQAGIARGKMTEDDLAAIHKMMLDDIESAKGKIDDIYYCPHGWNDGCDCRKPKPGLLYRASRDHAFQLDDALFIGDDERDEIAGLAAGCKPVLTNELFSLEVIVDTLLARGADYTYLLHLILKAKAIKPKVVIAIAGQSRAGKSTIAETIKRDLLEHHNIQTQVLALDNFIISLDKRPTDSTVRSRYDYRKINETIEKICNGESVQLPYYDSRTRTTKQDGELFSPISQGVILVEGVVALDAIDDAQQIDIKVYVTTDEVARKQRFREFYTIHKLLPAREVDELIRERYRDEFPIVHNSIQNADLLIRN